MIGWANVTVRDRRVVPELGYAAGHPPRAAAFRAALDDELGRLERFLQAVGDPPTPA